MGSNGAQARTSTKTPFPTTNHTTFLAARRGREGARVKPSAISTAQLQRLHAVDLPPIHQVVYLGPYSLAGWQPSSRGRLRA